MDTSMPPLPSSLPTGRWISFEGIDGAGKSSQVKALQAWCTERGIQVWLTREPGGSDLAEKLRALILHEPMDALTEALLFFAARRDHVQRTIQPHLQKGTWVLCDRFVDASFAYQGAGRGFDGQILTQLEQWVLCDQTQRVHYPDLTLWFDLPVEMAIERLSRTRTPDRFEALDASFFERVRAGYAQRMHAHPDRIVRIDAALSPAQVSDQILQLMQSHFKAQPLGPLQTSHP
jgi:dTMP kinase